MTNKFSRWYQSSLQAINGSLLRFLPPLKEEPYDLHRAMHYSVVSGGKRIRPLLTLATGELFNIDPKELIPSAVAVEYIHAYSLIHDDMPEMDNDVLRRGIPTVHVKFSPATALLAGDALQALAFFVISSSKDNPQLINQRVQLLSQCAGYAGMCGGQAIDLHFVGQNMKWEELQSMHSLKTGALLKAAVLLGTLGNSNATDEQRQLLTNFAQAFGLGFQIIDDILDATKTTAALGKTAGKDARDNKPTAVSLFGLDKAKQLVEQLQQQALDALSPFGENAFYLRSLTNTIFLRGQ